MSQAPSWLRLFAPLPDGVVPERKPVASAEQIAAGTAGPIEGWQSVMVHLSAPAGSRNILVTVDAAGKLLSAGDHVLFVSEGLRDGVRTAVYNHESVGGRYEDDGSFRGTRWQTRTEQVVASDDDGWTTSVPSPPSDDDVVALNRIVADVLARST
jgi:hypothetical protein